jgi:UDP-N-acetylmuramate: L-alanyl-gamma-D-glutamyl-meso-diaminopimelate ligase
MTHNHKNIYFVGIGGTGMSAAAGLMKLSGANVAGSDQRLYEPTNSILKQLKVPLYIPYKKENITTTRADLYVIGNSLSQDNIEVQTIVEKNLPYTSFPALLSNSLLNNKSSIVISGTHGKTTSSSLLSYCLSELGEDPSFFIGGFAKDLQTNFKLSQGKTFVLEGDEYDTAFFDKNPKFLHYKPEFLLINNLEFDHADIYKNIDEIKNVFKKLIKLVKYPQQIVVNIDDENICSLIADLQLSEHVIKISQDPKKDAHINILVSTSLNSSTWKLEIKTPFGHLQLKPQILGNHNAMNICAVIGVLAALEKSEKIKPINTDKLCQIISSFQGVKKRLEFIGKYNNTELFLDFAHHPSSCLETIKTFKKLYPQKKIIAAFEPRNASSRRNIFIRQYAHSLSYADTVLLAPCFEDNKIPETQRMNTKELSSLIRSTSFAFSSFEHLQTWLIKNLNSNSLVIFMTCADFNNIPHNLSR